MSTQEAEQLEPIDETAPSSQDGEMLVRTFPVEVTSGDGRTIDARIVPYNEAATVGDPPWAPKVIYRESFMPGAFAAQTNAPDRVKVWLNFEHEQGLRGIVGHGVKLREQPDALYGTFRVHQTDDGEKALALVREGVLGALSLEFRPLRSIRRDDGLVQRTKAHLDTVSLCRRGAYEQSQILALRSEPVILSEAELPKPFNPELATLFRSFGVDVPEELVPEEDQVLMRAFTEQAWDGSPSRFTDTNAYCRSCLIDDNPPGKPKAQAMCHLPIREPNGDVNINAVRNALARVNQVSTSAENKARARRRLEALLAQFNNRQGTSD